MLSVATVRSAGGAASYFAADNYYTADAPEGAGLWFGKGADALGLRGVVEADAFEAVLRGTLPNGIQLGSAEHHRAGTDLTFSLPKSWSLLALVGGDRRIVIAYQQAVRDTLAWAERNAVATRRIVGGRDTVVRTDNMVAALFTHDMSRAQDPQVHIHAVVANATQGPDGKWRVLHNDQLWSLNTLLNAITMSGFRERVEALGYAIGDVGKHGNFDAAGFSRDALMTFSTRRQQILAKGAEMGAKTPEAMQAATLMTRPRKAAEPDHATIYASWRESAAAIGLDLPGMVAAAEQKASQPASSWQRLGQVVGHVASRGRGMMAALGERLGLSPGDPYLPRGLGRMDAADLAAAHAVASARRHLEQREAAFLRTDVLKAALDTGLPVSVDAIERRIVRLERDGQLLPGQGKAGEMITTAGAIRTEQRLLNEVVAGRDRGAAFVAAEDAATRLDAAASATSGITLNAGQRAAGVMLLSSSDRIVAVQGVAGAGKSSVLAPVAAIVSDTGRPVLGLAIQNTLVQMLRRETGMPVMTVARFLGSHRQLLDPAPDPHALHQAREAWNGGMIVVDEASMLSNQDQLQLVRLANLLEVGRMAFVGDAKQLGAVDAGKPFALMQAHGATTAEMNYNLRARGDAVRAAAIAAQVGSVQGALAALKPYTLEAPGGAGTAAAALWLALPKEERERTAIYASGRRLRAEVNAAVQDGLVARGEIGRGKVDLPVLSRVNLSDEQLRDPRSYETGMVVELGRAVRRQALPAGLARVHAVDQRSGSVSLVYADGRERTLRPSKLGPTPNGSPISLHEMRSLTIHEGERIRWTTNDTARGFFNADQAQVTGIMRHGIEVRVSDGRRLVLGPDDPMLQRLDLSYALNAHMAQGLTADRGIAVIESRDGKLVNQQTFLVTVTRVREALALVVDRVSSIERHLLRQHGDKSSALETASGRLEAPSQVAGQSPLLLPEMTIEPNLVKPFEICI